MLRCIFACGCCKLSSVCSNLSTMHSPSESPVKMGQALNGGMNIKGIQEKLVAVVEWLNALFPYLKLSLETSEEELRVVLKNGRVFYSILSRISPGTIIENQGSSPFQGLLCIKKFLSIMKEMGLPRFEVSDLDKGSMTVVLDCLVALRDDMDSTNSFRSQPRRRLSATEFENLERMNSVQMDKSSRRQNSFSSGEERKFRHVLQDPVASGPSTSPFYHAGHKFHEVFQLKQGQYSDLPAAKISEMLKSNSLDNAPTQSLLSVVNAILDESIERKNGEIPQRVSCLLRKVIQEIERRISTQAEQIRSQSNLMKTREEKYQSRVKVLETLASGPSEESQGVKTRMESRTGKKDVVVPEKERENSNLLVSILKEELEKTKRTYEERCLQLEKQVKDSKLREEDIVGQSKEKENSEVTISKLKDELQTTNRVNEERCLQLEKEAKESKQVLEEKLKEVENLLAESMDRTHRLEAVSELKAHTWNEKDNNYRNFTAFQFQALQELRLSSGHIKKEIINAQRSRQEDFVQFGTTIKRLAHATENYQIVLSENRKLYNEVQDLKGKIRVYCRIRPFLPGETKNQTSIEYIGEDGELMMANPCKQGKEGQRMFKFNKVYSPTASQAEVFLDTQPLIRTILDGYNVCIFAYGQTGSGKTYTMTGPEAATKETCGVNYRALNDLFEISQNRIKTFKYEIEVQMVEIYNEQVRDLLANDGSQKKLGISFSQPNGLAVPDASMHPVKSTTDVVELMQIGHMNRTVGATALNVRSSRSHSILTVHVRGTNLETGAASHGSLHLVDLAGSERADRSEATGERLREAQYINKSLSALGDVIFALAQKSSHVPYRNSKLTQVLQGSLGGQAKTLMFVQLNPDPDSFSESISTLKFAERVSGIELGASRRNKEGKDVKELMEQIASLKDTITKKEEEIEHLQLLTDPRTHPLNAFSEKLVTNTLRHISSAPSLPSSSGPPHRKSRSLLSGKHASELDNCSEQSEASSHQSLDEVRNEKGDTNPNFTSDVDISSMHRVDSEERLSEISDGGLSVGTETDASADLTVSPESEKYTKTTAKMPKVPSQFLRRAQKPLHTTSSQATSKISPKVQTGLRKPATAHPTASPSRTSSRGR